MIEINLTPNRPDCTGVHGIARDLAAADMGKLRAARFRRSKAHSPCVVSVTLDLPRRNALALPRLCAAARARANNGPSPDWLRRRLTAIGLRPINALVDGQNLSLDRGRPLHVFDAAKVNGNLVVRRGRDGESLTALDGKQLSGSTRRCA